MKRLVLLLAVFAACQGPDVEVAQSHLDPLPPERPSEEPLLRALFGSFAVADVTPTLDEGQRFYLDSLWRALDQIELYKPDWEARPATPARREEIRRLLAGFVALHPLNELERDLVRRQDRTVISNTSLGCIARSFDDYQPDASPTEYSRRVSRFVRHLRDRRGASFEDMFTLYILSEDGPRGFFRYDGIYKFSERSKKVFLYPGEWTSGVYRNLADDVFGRKATPSLAYNNEVAAAIARPIPWNELGMTMSDDFIQYWMRDWVAKQLYEHPVATAFIPVLGQVVALTNRLLDVVEGRDMEGASIDRLWSVALFMGEYALAVVDFYGAAAAVRYGATLGVRGARATSERLGLLLRAARQPGRGGLSPKGLLAWIRRIVGEGVKDTARTAGCNVLLAEMTPQQAAAAATRLEADLDAIGNGFRRGQLTLEQAVRRIEDPRLLAGTGQTIAEARVAIVNAPRTAAELEEVAHYMASASHSDGSTVKVGAALLRDGRGGFLPDFHPSGRALDMERLRLNFEERYHSVQYLRERAGQPGWSSELFRRNPAGIPGVRMTPESDVYRKLLEVVGPENVPAFYQRLMIYPERATVPIPGPQGVLLRLPRLFSEPLAQAA